MHQIAYFFIDFWDMLTNNKTGAEGAAQPQVIALLVALAVGLFLYALKVPKNTGDLSIGDENADGMKIISALGNDIYKSLPRGVGANQKGNPKIENLLMRSGNPWGFRDAHEFQFSQITWAFLGFVMSFVFWYFLNMVFALPLPVVVIAITLFMYFMPYIKYNDQAKKRDLEFTKRLPEALDLIIICVSAGQTFPNALRASLDNMEDSDLKEEFKNMSRKLDSGETLYSVLDDFATRAPNDGVQTFIRSLQEATALNVPIIDTLKARSEASREDFFALVNSKVAALETQMMGILTPTLIPSILIIVMAPAIVQLMNNM